MKTFNTKKKRKSKKLNKKKKTFEYPFCKAAYT